jgi:hypothetical protein
MNPRKQSENSKKKKKRELHHSRCGGGNTQPSREEVFASLYLLKTFNIIRVVVYKCFAHGSKSRKL